MFLLFVFVGHFFPRPSGVLKLGISEVVPCFCGRVGLRRCQPESESRFLFRNRPQREGSVLTFPPTANALEVLDNGTVEHWSGARPGPCHLVLPGCPPGLSWSGVRPGPCHFVLPVCSPSLSFQFVLPSPPGLSSRLVLPACPPSLSSQLVLPARPPGLSSRLVLPTCACPSVILSAVP